MQRPLSRRDDRPLKRILHFVLMFCIGATAASYSTTVMNL